MNYEFIGMSCAIEDHNFEELEAVWARMKISCEGRFKPLAKASTSRYPTDIVCSVLMNSFHTSILAARATAGVQKEPRSNRASIRTLLDEIMKADCKVAGESHGDY